MIDLSLAPSQRSERYRPDVGITDPIEAFRQALANHGIVPKSIDPSGSLVRVDVEKPGDKAGWYLLHLDGLAAGSFGNWKTGLSESWCSKDRKDMTDSESAEQTRIYAESKRQRDLAEKENHANAKAKAIKIWEESEPIFVHPYLTKKGVQAHGLKESRGNLVIPLRDENGELHSLQFIHPVGTGKLFLSKGRVSGLSHTIPGDSNLVICEGYATGATINQATGATVICAFNSGNLEAVAKVVRAKCPHHNIIICADNDRFTAGNPGITKATKASKSISAKIVFPVFDGLEGADDPELKYSDFNDLAAVGGIELVTQQAQAPAAMSGKLLPLTPEGAMVHGRLKKRPPAIEFIFKINDQGLIARGIVGVLAAESGTGKTHFLLSMAIAGAEGGNFGPINAPRPLKTLVILCEDDQDELDRRLWDIAKGKFHKNLHAVSVYGEIGPLMRLEGSNPVYADMWYWLDESVSKFPGLDLLIIDPKSRFYGLDENNNDHATQWVNALEAISKKHKVTIIFSSHTSKGNAKEISQDMVRGGGAIVASCRWQAGMIKMPEKYASSIGIEDYRSYVLFDAPKSNYTADMPSVLCFKKMEGGVLEYCEPGNKIAVEMAEALLEMLTNDTTKYSKRDLEKQPVGLGVTREMKEKFPGFVRSKDMAKSINHLVKNGKLFEIEIGTGGAGNQKTVLSASRF